MHPDAPLFFDRAPQLLGLYEAFEQALLARLPEISIRVQKTQISFDAPGLFACVSQPRRKSDLGIVVTFTLAYRLDSERIRDAVEPYPGRWTHHMLLGTAEELDDELMAWLCEAYAFSLTRRHVRR